MSDKCAGPRVLHVVVGHGLPVYFLNAVRSVRACAPGDPLLVIDNASPDDALRGELVRLGDEDPLVEVLLRTSNDIEKNGKVGELYDAYAEAFAYAVSHGFDLLHLLQGDIQMLWWDEEVVERALALFEIRPRCVNISTMLFSTDKRLTDDLVDSEVPGVAKLAGYGLTDTGLYHLERWQRFEMQFDADETLHAKRYVDAGHEVLCHPWPTDAPIPWPAVIRRGERRGGEVRQREPFLLRPLASGAIAQLKASKEPVWIEDVAVAWGWLCLRPMWMTDTDAIDYWVLRYRQARRDGLVAALPRLDRRGLPGGGWLRLLSSYEHRPPLWRLVLVAPLKELRRRLGARAIGMLAPFTRRSSSCRAPAEPIAGQ